MNFIVTNKHDHAVLGVDTEVVYLDNGNPMLKNRCIAFIYDIVEVHEVAEIPEEDLEGKYCYTPEKGFYENPLWQPPYDPNAKVKGLETTVTELLNQVTDLQMALCDVYEMLPTEEV